jgi:hypothetical protein
MQIKIFTVTKNEFDLINEFILYYGSIFGFENIIIIDNGSDDQRVLNTYEKYKTLFGITVYTELGYNKNDQGNHFTKIMSIYKDSCDFLIGLDTDEFMALKIGKFVSIKYIKPYFQYLYLVASNRIKISESFQINTNYQQKIKTLFQKYYQTNNQNFCFDQFLFGFYANSSYPEKTNDSTETLETLETIETIETRETIKTKRISPIYKIDQFHLFPYYKKRFYLAKNFVLTKNGNHKGFTQKNASMKTNLLFFHYHDTGMKRVAQRTEAIFIAYNYLNPQNEIFKTTKLIWQNPESSLKKVHSQIVELHTKFGIGKVKFSNEYKKYFYYHKIPINGYHRLAHYYFFLHQMFVILLFYILSFHFNANNFVITSKGLYSFLLHFVLHQFGDLKKRILFILKHFFKNQLREHYDHLFFILFTDSEDCYYPDLIDGKNKKWFSNLLWTDYMKDFNNPNRMRLTKKITTNLISNYLVNIEKKNN